MNILFAIQGAEDAAFFRRVAAVAPLERAQHLLLAHVIDTGPRGGIELGRERYLGRRALGEVRSADLQQAEEAQARSSVQFARQALGELGVADDRLQEVVLRGKPNEELRRLAEEEKVDLIVVQGRAGKPGPHSVGKTARFLIDHSPHGVLLVR